MADCPIAFDSMPTITYYHLSTFQIISIISKIKFIYLYMWWKWNIMENHEVAAFFLTWRMFPLVKNINLKNLISNQSIIFIYQNIIKILRIFAILCFSLNYLISSSSDLLRVFVRVKNKLYYIINIHWLNGKTNITKGRW